MGKDLRKYASQTNFRLLLGFFIVLLGVGLGSIYLFWGAGSALSGLLCIGLALVPAIIIWLLLALLGWIVKKWDQ